MYPNFFLKILLPNELLKKKFGAGLLEVIFVKPFAKSLGFAAYKLE